MFVEAAPSGAAFHLYTGRMIQLPRMRRGTKPYREAVARTRALVHARLEYHSKNYTTIYSSVSIRKQKTRWGSCSAKGNLNFNYRLGFLPFELMDYIIVHELCHIREHNHSPAFWTLVGHTYPNHRTLRTELRKYRF
jgi:predicted metal-dependent hydrolase